MTALAENVMHFARILRRAGLLMGPGKVALALEALQAIQIGRRADIFHALQAVFVDRHAQSELFRLAFERFWQAPEDATQGLSAARSPERPADTAPQLPRRIEDAFGTTPAANTPSEMPDVVAQWSAAENLRNKDFQTMTAAEQAEARRLMATLRLPIADIATRRFRSGAARGRVDMRAMFKSMVRSGGLVELRRKQCLHRRPPLIVLCDISGSMTPYARMLLHFLHAITNDRDRVQVFLFGTRLTNVTRELAQRHPDEALARVSASVQDWSGGTRIGGVLGIFNRLWSRRVLGQGAVVLLISDGLDRDGGQGLSAEMERLHRSCRRLIWLNPLLRYAAFEPKSAGIRAMLPHVDDFRPAHNLDSLLGLIEALNAPARRMADKGSLWTP